MRRARLEWTLVASALAFAAVGCAKTTVVGSTAAEEPSPPGPAVEPTVPEPKRTSRISRGSEAALYATDPVLGDLDGDGFDDFLIAGVSGEPETRESLYLFYGRPEFRNQLSVDDADAVFEGDAMSLQALGDINGDGLADFSFARSERGSFEIVFGNPVRASGRSAAGTLTWKQTDLESPEDGTTVLQQLLAAGDVNCDGFGDLLVRAIRPPEPHEPQFDNALHVQMTHLVLGSASLPSGEYQSRWATARFERAMEPPPDQDASVAIELIRGGDLDADGCGDLVSVGGDGTDLFYGDPARYRGQLDPSDADARLVGSSGGGVAPLRGDLDGDGMAELYTVMEGELSLAMGLVYGQAQRWSGVVEIHPELTVAFPAAEGYAATRFAVGDIDGVAGPELVLSLSEFDPAAAAIFGEIYAIRGIGARRAGTYTIRDDDLVRIAPPPGAAAVRLGANFGVVGDVDGDDADDLVADGLDENAASAVYLVPSTPRPPD